LITFLIVTKPYCVSSPVGPPATGKLPTFDGVRCPALSDPEKVPLQGVPLRPEPRLHGGAKEAAGLPAALQLGARGAPAAAGFGLLQCQQDHQPAGEEPGGWIGLRIQWLQAGGVLLRGHGGGGGEAVAPGHPQDHRDCAKRARQEEHLQLAHGFGARGGHSHLADMAVLVDNHQTSDYVKNTMV